MTTPLFNAADNQEGRLQRLRRLRFKRIVLKKMSTWLSLGGCVLTGGGLFFFLQGTPSFNVCDFGAILLGGVGFSLKNLNVEGRTLTPHSIIFDSVKPLLNTPLFSYDLPQIHSVIEKNGWVKKAIIQRKLPDTLHIILIERTPIALWFHQGAYYAIDEEGVAIDVSDVRSFNHLPVLSGHGAPQNARAILSLLKKHPLVWKKTKSLAFIRNRRWDIRLCHGTLVKMPQNDIEDAFSKLEQLLKKEMSLNAETIDLRCKNKVSMKINGYVRPPKGQQT